MQETRFGSFVANALSLATRGLGYFLYVVAFAVYRHDRRAIAILAGGALLLAALVWLVS